MSKVKKKKFNKTEESIFTLLFLYVSISQLFESLTNEEDILHSDFDAAQHTFKDLVDDTIHEALVFQILLRTCGFLDEWNKIFGVTTEPEDRNKILSIKKIAKPAYQCITEWKNLRDFRNEVIAHNHRNREGKNIYLNYLPYHSPRSNGEIYLLVFCLKTMADVLHFFFKEIVEEIILVKLKDHKTKTSRPMSHRLVKAKMKHVEDEISSALANLQILSGVFPDDKNISVSILA